MRLTTTALRVAFLGSSIVSALNTDEYCVDGIYTALTSVVFNGSSAAAYVQASCQNPLKVATIYASATKYCTDHEISTGIAWLSETCFTYGLELLPYADFRKNLTQDYLSSLPVIDFGETITETVATVVIISQPYYDLGYRTIVCNRLLFTQTLNANTFRLPTTIRTGPIAHTGKSYLALSKCLELTFLQTRHVWILGWHYFDRYHCQCVQCYLAFTFKPRNK